MDKDLVEKTRKTLLGIDQMMAEINNYLIQLRRQAEKEIAELQRRTKSARQVGERTPSLKQVAPMGMVNDGDPVYPSASGTRPPTTTTATRDPYLAGRQPRRDGDSYGSVAAA